jgi:hypothetical protein
VLDKLFLLLRFDPNDGVVRLPEFSALGNQKR